MAHHFFAGLGLTPHGYVLPVSVDELATPSPTRNSTAVPDVILFGNHAYYRYAEESSTSTDQQLDADDAFDILSSMKQNGDLSLPDIVSTYLPFWGGQHYSADYHGMDCPIVDDEI